MKIETKNDLRLVGRSINESWKIPHQKVIDALMEVIENRDPDLMLGAAEILRKMDEVNIKREALRQREIKGVEDRRLQLLELAQRIPVGELAKLASGNSGGGSDSTSDQGRADDSAGADGPQASG